jgi:hypothetical protein
LNGVARKQVHNVETGGHDFGNGGDIVFGIVIDRKLPEFMAVCEVAVVASENDLFVIGDSD